MSNKKLAWQVLTFCIFFAHLMLCAQTYVVIDLSGGSEAITYPVRRTNVAPDLSSDTCRTTELWLRRIPAGTFTMGSPTDELGREDTDMVQHPVTISKDYYIGVFEVTQKQWELITGANPASFSGPLRPVEMVSYDDIRGNTPSLGGDWPTSGHAVDEDSFMGILRKKTGLFLDLPTEAQWEYACRAGTTTSLNSGKNITSADDTCSNANEVAKYRHNGGLHDQHVKVGQFIPNAWGLYDMHGNVDEWCLDWHGTPPSDTNNVFNPVGLQSGTKRQVRGGWWRSYPGAIRSAYRRDGDPANCRDDSTGLRIAYLPQKNEALVSYKLIPSTGKWRIDDGEWNESGAKVTTTVGEHDVSFQDVDGYRTPEVQTIVLIEGDVFEKEVVYAHASAPEWTTPTNLANSMTVDATVALADETAVDADGSMLAFFDAEGDCRGVATIRTTNWGSRVYSVQVWSDAARESGLTAKVWNAATGEVVDINGRFDFAQDTAMGSAMEPTELTAGLVTVTWTLNSGWNWVAANITPQNAGITDVLAGYTASNGDQIKTKDGYSTYYANYKIWDPALSIVPGRMYAFQRKASGSAAIEITGTPLAADNTLPLVAGWNWIGCFTDAERIAVSALASTGGFSNNDQLKGKGSAYTTYYKHSNFSGWDGTLTSMTAGNGYKFYVAKAGTLSASAVQTRGAEIRGAERTRGESGCPWTSPDNYANSMTLDAVVKLDGGASLETDGSAIGVFDAKGICRGVASIRTTGWGAVIYSGQVWSDAASEQGFTLKLWNGSTKEVTDLNETIDFTQDTAYGTAMEPVTFTEMAQKPEWEYSIDGNGNASITAYNGKAENVVIPAELDNSYPVTAIASGAFGTNNTITSVTLPVGITLPVENPFSGCRNLATVNYTLDGVRTDFGQNVNVNVAGRTVKEETLTLNPGWNLVALPQSELTPESRNALQNLESIFGFDASMHIYHLVTELEAGKPYWIFTKNAIEVKTKVK